MSAPTPSKFAAPLFAVTIGVGACLLFQVQFILGKQILPWFGGAPAVWTTCMLFFQVLLLLGYGYAHLLGSSRNPARQRTIHLTALGLASALLLARVTVWSSPITPADAWKPGPGDDPIVAILGLLVFTIGLPYLVLSSTGPLVQNWFGRCFPGRSPYRLYALSNLGSLLGLLSYPFLLEPQLPLTGQGWVWSLLFLVFAVACGGCAIAVGQTAPLPDAGPSGQVGPPPRARRKALWFSLAMIASVMLIAITSQISLEVAVIPFLWMLPLSLYLISFILCFEYERSYLRPLWVPLMLLGAGGTAALIRIGVDAPMWVQLVVYLVTLLAACMVCHGECVRSKPDPRYLTGFYLYVSAGGAAGGVFTGIVAPNLFLDLWELPIALIAAAAFAVGLTFRAWPAPAGLRTLEALAGGFVFAGIAGLLGVAAKFLGPRLLAMGTVILVAAAIGAVLISIGLVYLAGRLLAARSPVDKARVSRIRWTIGRMALTTWLIALTGVLAWHAHSELDDYTHITRGFFGVLRVDQDGAVGGQRELRTRLKHGRIIHGIQFADADLGRMPTSYYGTGSGVGLAIRHHPRRLAGEPLKLGFVGLGTGTLATYGDKGDTIRFYEINPDVVAMSAGPEAIFTYVRDCPAKVEVALGDARVNLEREPSQGFQVLALDAFSSDSIPAHLLTREAGELYLRHLAPDGILAVHISNRYLDLDPVVRGLADALGMTVVLIEDSENNDMVWQSDWMLLARDEAVLSAPEIQGASSDPPESDGLYPLWTDAYSNLLQVLKPA